MGCEPGCPCPECQPGRGINYGALRLERNRRIGESLRPRPGMRARDRARMDHLLTIKTLSPDEEAELDGLLNVFLHSS